MRQSDCDFFSTSNFAVSIPFPLQSATLKPYLTAVRRTLTATMCLENFSSQVVERHNKPEVEVKLVSFYIDFCVYVRIFGSTLGSSRQVAVVCLVGLRSWIHSLFVGFSCWLWS